MSLLSQGRWLEGWADYEYRWELKAKPGGNTTGRAGTAGP